MNPDRVLSLIDSLLPKDAIYQLKNDIDKLSQEQQQTVCTQISTVALTLKSPSIVFWVGSFFLGHFGVGRFMIGDKLLGFIRLGLCLLTNIVYLYSTVDNNIEFASHILFIAYFIWWIVDLFIVGKKLRQKNLDKISSIINEVANNNITKT